ncbi:MAG: hypothetical protein ABFC89_11390 [Methanospirillum sp.]
MNDLSEILSIRCSTADREIIDRLREDCIRGWSRRTFVRSAIEEDAACA